MSKLFDESSLGDFFKKIKLNQTLYRTFLLLGPAEFIESSLAVQIASILLCGAQNPPCGVCSACKKVALGIHPDVFVPGSREKMSLSIDDIRETIYEASIKPWEGKYKIFLLKKVDFLREEAANALLKILEEPPEHCIFLLTAENPAGVIDTIRSRCQIFHTSPPGANLLERIMQELDVPEDKAATLLSLSNGTWADILELWEKRWAMRTEMIENMVSRVDPIALGEKIATFCGTAEQGKQMSQAYILYLSSFWRDVLVCYALGQPASYSLLTNKDVACQIHSLACTCNIPKMEKLLYFLLFHTKSKIDFNVNLSLLWENIFLQIYTFLKPMK